MSSSVLPRRDALRRGACSGAQVRAYAEMIAVAAIGFPNVLTNVLATCDRPRIPGNLLEEEGVVAYRPGRRCDRRARAAPRHGVIHPISRARDRGLGRGHALSRAGRGRHALVTRQLFDRGMTPLW